MSLAQQRSDVGDSPGSTARLVAGIDEAGRGPLAGPVVAAAVILDSSRPVEGLMDSKVLSARRREELSGEIKTNALVWSVAWSDVAEIDSINILQATFLAMRRAILGLGICPSIAEIDGNRLPNLAFGDRSVIGQAIVGGDASRPAISAASILAKVHRDRFMCEMDALYPRYGFRQHKGYGTAAHRECLARSGPCPEHRRSFRPVAEACLRNGKPQPGS